MEKIKNPLFLDKHFNKILAFLKLFFGGIGLIGMIVFIINFCTIFYISDDNYSGLGIMLNALLGTSIGAFALIVVLDSNKKLKEQNKITRAYDLFYKELELVYKAFENFKQDYPFRNRKEESIETIIRTLRDDLETIVNEITEGKRGHESRLFNKFSVSAILDLLKNLKNRQDSIKFITTDVDSKIFKTLVKNNIPNNFEELLKDIDSLLKKHISGSKTKADIKGLLEFSDKKIEEFYEYHEIFLTLIGDDKQSD